MRNVTLVIGLTGILLLTGIIGGCERSGNELSFQRIPHYPASTPEKKTEDFEAAGTGVVKVTTLSTTDPFKVVVAFYEDELDRYHPEVTSLASEPGRKTVIVIKQKNRVYSVTIQEYSKEGRVVITHNKTLL